MLSDLGVAVRPVCSLNTKIGHPFKGRCLQRFLALERSVATTLHQGASIQKNIFGRSYVSSKSKETIQTIIHVDPQSKKNPFSRCALTISNMDAGVGRWEGGEVDGGKYLERGTRTESAVTPACRSALYADPAVPYCCFQEVIRPLKSWPEVDVKLTWSGPLGPFGCQLPILWSLLKYAGISRCLLRTWRRIQFFHILRYINTGR